MSLKLNSSGGGSVTLQEPVTASTLTLTLPAFSGTAATLASVTNNGVLFVNSSGQPTSGSALTFDGSDVLQLTATGNAVVNLIGSITNNAIFRLQNATTGNLAGIYANNSKQLIFEANGTTEQMRLTSTGLGIGTTSPGVKLDVNGGAGGASIRIDSTSNANAISLLLATAGATRASLGIANSTSDLVIKSEDAGGRIAGIQFWTGNASAERMRIDSSGNLLVGTTSVVNIGGLDTTHTFSTGITVKWAGGFRNTTSSAPYGLAIQYSSVSPNNTASDFIWATDSTIRRFSVASNGGISNYQANNVNLSDRREKTNFAPAKSYLDTICAIPVQTFNYADQNMEEDPGLTLGVVAQDVQAVAPELVMESNWGTQDEPKMRLSIYQTDLQYALMKALQEQQVMIAQLQADIASLKGTA